VRGARHVRELIALTNAGDRAAIVFVVQRPDATSFAPHHLADPDLASALREAQRAGVGVYAWSCAVTCERMVIDQPLLVKAPCH
jgi:sugar fermentation stimulation protein A